MNSFPNTLVDKIWFVFIGIVTIASILFLMVLVAALKNDNAQALGPTNSAAGIVSADISSSPNIITNAMVITGEGLSQMMASVVDSANRGISSVATATAAGGKTVARGAQIGISTAARGVAKGTVFVGKTIGKTVGGGAVFVFSIPEKVAQSISNLSMVSAVIRPSEDAEVPIIDPNSPELAAALDALPPTKNAPRSTKQGSSDPSWPIHGHITTEFGVPHWPYQRTHTGLDISDYKPSGITSIKPFRPGRVLSVVYSSYGYGNHVIVDHGNNVTSVYGHLASIFVNEGQEVTTSTVIGKEGSTGMSTGTHLHFEVRVNGQAADPRKFVSGNP